MNPFDDAGIFLVDTLFGLYILAVMLRFFLQYFRADPYNPVSQFLLKITHPVLRPMRRAIPAYHHIDTASVVLMFSLQFIALWLKFVIKAVPLTLVPVLILTVAELLEAVLNLFFFAILIRIVLSWLGPQGHNPVLSILDAITNPLLLPARRMLPFLSVSGFDLSPMAVLIVLQLAKFLIVQPMVMMAATAF